MLKDVVASERSDEEAIDMSLVLGGERLKDMMLGSVLPLCKQATHKLRLTTSCKRKQTVTYYHQEKSVYSKLAYFILQR